MSKIAFYNCGGDARPLKTWSDFSSVQYMDKTQSVVEMNNIILKMIQKLVFLSSSKVGYYESHKSNSGLGQKIQRYLSPVDTSQHNSAYKDKNWRLKSYQFLVLGLFI